MQDNPVALDAVQAPVAAPMFKVGDKVKHKASGEVAIVEEICCWGKGKVPTGKYKVAVAFGRSCTVDGSLIDLVGSSK